MTQAHKTPGALVKAHPDILPGGIIGDYYTHIHLSGRVFEVVDVNPPGHTNVIDIESGEKYGLHSENFITLSKQEKLELSRNKK